MRASKRLCNKTRTRGADECHTDALDRVKVKFHWQANPFALQPANTNHSCWVRVVQRAATAGGAAAASDTAALAESSDHRPSSQMNLVNSGSGGHSPAWHGMVRLQMGGSEYLWRFADPQMLQVTSIIMTPEQRIAVFGGRRSWWIVTADGTLKDMAFSTGKPNAETTQPLLLDAS